jgi:hypothetical protein
MLYQPMVAHPELVQFGLADAARHPELLDEIKQIPDVARRLLTAALEQASPLLRPECDVDVEVLGLPGMLLLLATWHARGWLHTARRTAGRGDAGRPATPLAQQWTVPPA